MSEDPAARRFYAIALCRLIGAFSVMLGILVHQGAIGWPEWVGFVLMVNGLVDIFILPLVLAKRWRSPKQ